jgi:hypothetical protein
VGFDDTCAAGSDGADGVAGGGITAVPMGGITGRACVRAGGGRLTVAGLVGDEPRGCAGGWLAEPESGGLEARGCSAADPWAAWRAAETMSVTSGTSGGGGRDGDSSEPMWRSYPRAAGRCRARRRRG